MSVRLLIGDCRDRLRELQDGSANTCVTSPPYFGLRDYGHAGQIGLEPTPDAFVSEMVEVFRDVRRVLRDDGTLWLNLGDSYASIAGGYSATGSRGSTAVIGAKTQAAVRKGAHSKEYRSWRAMKRRCLQPSCNHFANYGGRGITVCESWRASFPAFLADMGAAPSERHSIDRIDANGNYEPGNCRWATATEQANNRRNSLSVDGVPLSEACAAAGVKYSAGWKRVLRGADFATDYSLGRMQRAILAALASGPQTCPGIARANALDPKRTVDAMDRLRRLGKVSLVGKVGHARVWERHDEDEAKPNGPNP